jgi:hypothetical protein
MTGKGLARGAFPSRYTSMLRAPLTISVVQDKPGPTRLHTCLSSLHVRQVSPTPMPMGLGPTVSYAFDDSIPWTRFVMMVNDIEQLLPDLDMVESCPLFQTRPYPFFDVGINVIDLSLCPFVWSASSTPLVVGSSEISTTDLVTRHRGQRSCSLPRHVLS